MEKAAQKALDQIEDKKYDRKFQGQGQKIFKVALVIGHYSEVVTVIQEAKNWRLVPDLVDGLFRVEKS
jgi:hypothetical protein